MNFQRSVTYSTNFNLLILLLVIIIVHELRRCSLRRYKIRIHRTQERYGVSGINTIPSTTNIYIYIHFHFTSSPSRAYTFSHHFITFLSPAVGQTTDKAAESLWWITATTRLQHSQATDEICRFIDTEEMKRRSSDRRRRGRKRGGNVCQWERGDDTYPPPRVGW